MTQLKGNFRRFFDIWASFRKAGELVPQWVNVKPMQFGDLLSEVSLVKKHGKNDYRNRVIGSGLTQRLGGNPVGENILQLFHPDHHGIIDGWFDRIISHPCASFHEMSADFANEARPVRGMNLPVRGKDGDIDTFLYFHETWQPTLGEDLGPLLSLGQNHFTVRGVDIGAGLPALVPAG